MSEKFEILLGNDTLPTAFNVDGASAEYIDFNLEVLNSAYQAEIDKGSRRNPADRILRDIEADIIQILGSVPRDFKAAKKAANKLDGTAREKSQYVQTLQTLYFERDAAKFPAFADALANSVAQDLTKNQGFYASEGLITKIIEAQASSFREYVDLGHGATYDALPEDLKDLIENLLMFLEVFVSLDEDSGSFTQDMSFFEALATLSYEQVLAVTTAVNAVEISKTTGSHYAPYIMLAIQALFAIDSEGTLSAFQNKEARTPASYETVYVFLGSLNWPSNVYVNRDTFRSIADDMQGSGVESKVTNLAIHVVVNGMAGTPDLKDSLITAGVLGEDAELPRSVLEQVFAFAKALNICFPNMVRRKSIFGSAMSKQESKAAFDILVKKFTTPPSIEPQYIWDAFVKITLDEFTENYTHYMKWAFGLIGEMFKQNGISNYDSTPSDMYDLDKATCENLGSPQGSGALRKWIALSDFCRDSGLKTLDVFGDMSQKTKSSRAGLVAAFKRVVPAEHKDVVDVLDSLSVGSAALSIFAGSLEIEDPFNLKDFRYEVVDLSDFSGYSVAISKPFNPLELVSGYKTLGDCCMKPYQPGTKASMSSFYGNIASPTVQGPLVARTAYVFAHAVTRKGKKKAATECLGTMYLPTFNVTYGSTPTTSAGASAELFAGPTAILYRTRGVAPVFPPIARSFDGWEHTASARGIPSDIQANGPSAIVSGILQSTVGLQMGLNGSMGGAAQDASLREGVPSDLSFSTQCANVGTHLDYSSPSATQILCGVLDVHNPNSMFEGVTFTLNNEDTKSFTMAYAPKRGVTPPPPVDVSWEYMRYIWSLPMGPSFLTFEGSVRFEIPSRTKKLSAKKSSIVQEISDVLVVPEWFYGCDARPLKRGGQSLKTKDLIEMRTPRLGVSISAGGSEEFILSPRG